MTDIKKIIGKNISQLRKQRELTQEELAHRAGLHTTFIAHIEKGRKVSSVKSLDKIAGALKVPVYTLFQERMKGSQKLYCDTATTKILNILRDRSDNEKDLFYRIARNITLKRKK